MGLNCSTYCSTDRTMVNQEVQIQNQSLKLVSPILIYDLYLQKLDEATEKKAIECFSKIDRDGSGSIDKQEANTHLIKSFKDVKKTTAFFELIDVNNDGQISQEEFIQFWEMIKGSGHSDAEIS